MSSPCIQDGSSSAHVHGCPAKQQLCLNAAWLKVMYQDMLSGIASNTGGLLLLLESNLNEVQHASPLTEDNNFLLGDGGGRGGGRAAGGPP